MPSGLDFISENPFTGAYDRRLKRRYEQDRADAEMDDYARQRRISDATDAAARKVLGSGKSGLYDINTGMAGELSQVPGAGEAALGYQQKALEGREADEERVLELGLQYGPEFAEAEALKLGVEIPDQWRQGLRNRQFREQLSWSLGAAREKYGTGAENAKLRSELGKQLMSARTPEEMQAVLASAPEPIYRAPQGPIGYGEMQEHPQLGWGQFDDRGQWHPASGVGGGAGQRPPSVSTIYTDTGEQKGWLDASGAFHPLGTPRPYSTGYVTSQDERVRMVDSELEAMRDWESSDPFRDASYEEQLAEAQRRVDLKMGGGQPAPAGPGATPGPAAAPVDRGSGTEDDPFRPTTAEEFAVIKPGEIYIDPGDGLPYRKK